MSLFHLHARRRGRPYPARSLGLRALDAVVYAVGILGPLATIPQVVQIFSTHDASGISVVTWGIYALFDIPWIAYALVHREPPLIVCYALWFVFNGLVAAGAVIYGGSMGL